MRRGITDSHSRQKLVILPRVESIRSDRGPRVFQIGFRTRFWIGTRTLCAGGDGAYACFVCVGVFSMVYNSGSVGNLFAILWIQVFVQWVHWKPNESVESFELETAVGPSHTTL